MPQLSVVIPVFDERDNVVPLLAEIAAALQDVTTFETVIVDDASDDDTLAVLQDARRRFATLRILHHHTRCGQSTALWHGVQAASAPWVATLDGDGQNDPADIAALLAARANADHGTGLFIGWRRQRRDTLSKRVSSRIANSVRARMLGDATPDTGCGLKLFERERFLKLPWFDHMHRYLPALFKRAGYTTQSVPVSHRPRTRGASKYGMLDRLWAGLADLRGVAWLMRRTRSTRVDEIDPD